MKLKGLEPMQTHEERETVSEATIIDIKSKHDQVTPIEETHPEESTKNHSDEETLAAILRLGDFLKRKSEEQKKSPQHKMGFKSRIINKYMELDMFELSQLSQGTKYRRMA